MNVIKYFKIGKINNTVMILNQTAKIDNHITLSIDKLSNNLTNSGNIKNPKTVENKLKKKWLYATCFFKLLHHSAPKIIVVVDPKNDHKINIIHIR